MPKFPVDAPKQRVIKALEILGFKMVRERAHRQAFREMTFLKLMKRLDGGLQITAGFELFGLSK